MSPIHYQADSFPPDARLDWRRLAPVIGPAATALARYDSLLGTVPGALDFLSVLRIQEAVCSSRIENIYTSVGTVLELDAGVEPDNRYAGEDAREVLNYLAAERHAIALLGELPLSLRVVREAHGLLLRGPRGRGKSPGEFRRGPVWIGGPSSTLANAVFVPATAAEVPGRMSVWERYIHAGARDRLVQIAVQHAEFEAIHPFLDGNGRLGRMLIPLLLWKHGLLREPAFDLSLQIAARRGFYYDGLLGVSRDDDWTGWCLYFLDAVRARAEDGAALVTAILDLYRDYEQLVGRITRAGDLEPALKALFSRPVFRTSEFIALTGLSARTARRLVARLTEQGVLEEIASSRGSRPAVMRFPELIALLNEEAGADRWT